MIPTDWYAAGPLAYLWQVALHSAIGGFVLYAWAHRVGLPSGRAKRRLLGVLLGLPLLTAAVPGRAGPEFREQLAWLDSGRILGIPLFAGLRVHHVALAVLATTVVVTLWQEVVPVLRRRSRAPTAVPDDVRRLVRAQPGWDRCEIVVDPAADIGLATGGWPWRPRLLVSRGALGALPADELEAAIVHEHAHWQAGRWALSHALFVVRLLQPHNPVALWVFREYCLEIEIACDAAAVAGRDPRVLTRALLKIYETTRRGDVAARGALRKRVDVLLEAGVRDDALPLATTLVASTLLAVLLPWVV